MKLLAVLGAFLPCPCQRLFITKDLKLSKRQGTCRNISPCIKRANQGKKRASVSINRSQPGTFQKNRTVQCILV